MSFDPESTLTLFFPSITNPPTYLDLSAKPVNRRRRLVSSLATTLSSSRSFELLLTKSKARNSRQHSASNTNNDHTPQDIMDQLKGAFNSFSGGNKNSEGEVSQQAPQGSTSGHPQPKSQESGGGGFLGGLGEKFNSAAGGGKESEKNEDYLDKGELPKNP
jgi:hypothetical protein